MADRVFDKIKGALLNAQFDRAENVGGLPLNPALQGMMVAAMPEVFDDAALHKVASDYGADATVLSNADRSRQWLALSGPVLQLKTNLRNDRPAVESGLAGYPSRT